MVGEGGQAEVAGSSLNLSCTRGICMVSNNANDKQSMKKVYTNGKIIMNEEYRTG